MEGSTPSTLPPPTHQKRSGDSPETPTRQPAFRPDAVRGREEDPPAEDGIGPPRLRPSRPHLPNPRFPSLNNTSYHRNALKTRTRCNPPITNALPPRQQRRKKKKMQAEEGEEKEKEKENEEPLPPLPPPPPPSLPMWNLRSRRRAASGDQKTGLPFRPLPDRDNPLPIRQKSPTFSFALSKAEIKNDFMHITGKRPGWRPKKRWPRSIQQQLGPLFPGEFLSNIRRHSWWDSWDDIF
ncbi:WAS/WASL-interacting protein family member 3-like [Ananas comosus]|uniref:WAS/WASL-interacting protein family member 3-like n=1 Tax=Ananas comosus TaxID=4615 RepID=A0A6P5GZY1_ANACO|nr:WAS/WASL-interacting protein family member 3-like [Ananas comosus]XP_020111316.1 WAS/WASL-interacting protein family member 3-like [Ananas comosus]XP_020111317.1 WAS/WASL-interacting protein family member 3-like [Ananas comosus]